MQKNMGDILENEKVLAAEGAPLAIDSFWSEAAGGATKERSANAVGTSLVSPVNTSLAPLTKGQTTLVSMPMLSVRLPLWRICLCDACTYKFTGFGA